MSQIQIKVTLPAQLRDHIKRKADHYGLPLAGYIRHVLINDVKHSEYVTLSAEADARYAKIESELERGENTKTAETVDELMRDLSESSQTNENPLS